ncbi:hypothetical protein, partial [Enterobacter hormaechei]|uniref:hypothetical protein n=1 Tax=Enterobacter hormaechei TaxID=158836 RepID=UPI001C5441A5
FFVLFPYVPNQACLIPVAKQNAIFSVCLKKHRRLDISCIVMPGMRGARNIKIVQIILHFSLLAQLGRGAQSLWIN